jgi:hypothetical protein
LHLTVFHADSADFAETACESFTWGGTTYIQSGDYTKTFTNANGCDSVVTLHLTVFHADSADFAETACESFTWEGTTFTESGDYTKTFTNANGCDSVVTLHLTVFHADSADFAVTACESFTWEGTTYTNSGDYTKTFTNANGCDSIVTLHLTITVGIDKHNDFAFNIYPNPTNGIVNVQWTMDNVQVGAMEYHVFDAFGKLVKVVMTDVHGSSAQTAQIDLSGFANGVYFVKAVEDGNVVAVRKVVKR